MDIVSYIGIREYGPSENSISLNIAKHVHSSAWYKASFTLVLVQGKFGVGIS